MSAVSTKLMPASSARWMMRIESVWSVLPQAPNIIVPRQSFETWTPVRPRGRYSMGPPVVGGLAGAGRLGRRRPAGEQVERLLRGRAGSAGENREARAGVGPGGLRFVVWPGAP